MVSFLFALGMLFTPLHHTHSQPVHNPAPDYSPQIVTVVPTEEPAADPMTAQPAVCSPAVAAPRPAVFTPAVADPRPAVFTPAVVDPRPAVFTPAVVDPRPAVFTPADIVEQPAYVAPAPITPAPTISSDSVPIAAPQHVVDSTEADAPQSTMDLSTEESGLVELINADRAANGLAPVSVDPTLTAIARAHSQDMADRSYFDHIAPGPGPASPMDRYLATIGYRPPYAMVGENIYYRSLTDEPDQTQNQAETAFMNSPGHRANILQPRYTKVGVGFYRDDNGQFWVTEMFLRDEP